MIKAAIFGYGTVGSGIYEVLTRNSAVIQGKLGDRIEVKYVLDLREFPSDPVQDVLVHDVNTILDDEEVSIICETMGGEKPAYDFTRRALELGKSVCTSNKELVEKHGAELLKIAQEQLEKNPNHSLFVLGELGRHYFEQRGIEIEKQFHYTVQNPTLNRARNISEEIIELYRKGELDEVYIIYTSMINAIQEETQIEQLLPLKKADFNIQIPVDFKREELALKPSPEVVMDRIVPDYIVGFVYGALVESFSCEQNARMMAMEAASKSAKDMLHDLDIQYNRARQASITQEITEVIAGAKSQKKKRKK